MAHAGLASRHPCYARVVPSDDQLLEAWRAGDLTAGNDLFARYFDGLCRFFRNKVGDDVDDLIQRTLLACLEGQHGFRGDASFKTWVFVVARHELYGHLRRRQRDADRFDPLTQSVLQLGTTPSQWAGRREARRLVLDALQTLPIEHQVLLELYYWEDLSASEIGVVLDKPEGTIRTRLRRAKELLAAALDGVEDHERSPEHERAADIADDLRSAGTMLVPGSSARLAIGHARS